jgi:DNA-binding CsgD family transcriptional regulator
VTARLTPTEERIAALVAAGRSNPEVAAELGLTRKTVEWHLSRVYRKLGARSRDDLARLAPPVGRAGRQVEPDGPLSEPAECGISLFRPRRV